MMYKFNRDVCDAKDSAICYMHTVFPHIKAAY